MSSFGQDISFLNLLALSKVFFLFDLLDDISSVKLIDLNFLQESNIFVLRDEWIDEQVDNLQNIGNNDHLTELLEFIYSLVSSEEGIKFFDYFLVALVLIKLLKKFHIFVKFHDQDLDSVTKFVNSAIFILEKLLYVVFNEVAQLVIGLQHSQETVEVKMHGLECSI